MELEIQRGSSQTTIVKALPQIPGYMDRCGASGGHLIIFNQSDSLWEDKIVHDQTTHQGVPIVIWGM